MSSPDTNQISPSGASTLELVPASHSGDATAPASPSLSPEQFAAEFLKMAATLDAIGEEIIAHVLELAAVAPSQDALINGLLEISKTCRPLNTWLIGAQLAIRCGQPINTQTKR